MNHLQQQKAWNEITLEGEFEKCIGASENEKRITLNTLDRKFITLKEFDEWKNENWNEIGKILKSSNYKEYSALKKIVNKIEEKKENEKRKASNKFEVLQDDDSITEDNEARNRTDHPTTKESPPPEGQEGEGRGV